MATPGCVVEFLHDGEPQLAWVEEEAGGRLRLYTLHKRETKMPASRLLPWIGPRREGVFTKEAILEHLREHARRRAELAQGVSSLEIWDMAQGEVGQASAAWFAQLVFDTPDVDQVAAVGRVLLDLKSHFKFQPPNFEVFTAEVVEKRLEEQAVSREREMVVTAGQAFFHELWSGWASGRSCDVPKLAGKLDPQAAAKLKDMLLGLMADAESQEWAGLWQLLRKGLPEHPHLALILAMQWGVVGPHHNYLLDQAGYAAGDAWSAAHQGEIEALRADFATKCQPGEQAGYVSVDSPTTRDIDDAFAVSARPGGGWLVKMALARPCLSWDFASPLAREVWQRATSLYLPEGVSHMLPEGLGCGLYSLKAGEDRPALFLDWEMGEAGQVLSFAPRLGWVRVTANLTYASVEEELAGEGADESLALGWRLAETLRQGRIGLGAVILDKPEPKICLKDYPQAVKVEITLTKEHPRAQSLVSELMILANASLAKWAGEHSLPLLHRVQDIALPQGFSGVWTSPADMHRVMKQLTGAVQDVRPGRHASLGVQAYSPVTSPLRRLTDFVNLAQVQAFLATGQAMWNAVELEARLAGVNSRQEQVGQVQRQRPRYWKLLFVQQTCQEQEFEGVVVEDCNAFAILSLPLVQIYVRAGREQLGGKIFAGQTFRLRLGKVDPLAGEVRVLGAVEIEGRARDGDWPQ